MGAKFASVPGSFLLVHSPLVGPSTLASLAERLAGRGTAVATPDLTGVATAEPPVWRHLVASATSAATDLPGSVVVVGHSGAGAYLPAIGRRLEQRLGALVFVDAGVPPLRGAHRTPARLLEVVDALTVDGMLPPWSEWWPPEAIAELLPDPAVRAALSADMPRLPRRFFDEEVPVPPSWSNRPCAYLRLSDAYAAQFEEAGSRGWPRAVIEGTHLSIVTDPGPVMVAIDSLLEAVGSDPGRL